MATVDELLEHGDDAYAEGEFEEALECAEEALEQEPDSLAALDLKAGALAELGDFEAADEAFAELIDREPKNVGFLHGAADVLIRQPGDDAGRSEEGLALIERALPLAKKDLEMTAELELLRGAALSQLGELDEALRAFSKVLDIDPDNAEARLERAIALFELGRIDEAKRAFEKFSADYPDDPWGFHYQGLVAERLGKDPRPLLEKARRLDPDEFPPPVHLPPEDFDRAVEEAIARLPEHARPHLDNVIIDVRPIPEDEDVREGLSPTILGVFRGTAIDERSPINAAHHETARITLFQNNLERFCSTREQLIEEIGVTVLHEVGHLLGLDEDELFERGLD